MLVKVSDWSRFSNLQPLQPLAQWRLHSLKQPSSFIVGLITETWAFFRYWCHIWLILLNGLTGSLSVISAPSCPVAVLRVNMSSAVIVIQEPSSHGPGSDVDLTTWHCPGCSSTGGAFRGQLSPVQATHGCSVLCSCGDKKVGEATPNKWLEWQRIVLWCADTAWHDDYVTISEYHCVTWCLCDKVTVFYYRMTWRAYNRGWVGVKSSAMWQPQLSCHHRAAVVRCCGWLQSTTTSLPGPRCCGVVVCCGVESSAI